MCDTLTFYKALSEPTRLISLLLLSEHGELCVCDLMEALALSQPKISRHLAELRKHQLVVCERRSKWVYYQLHPTLSKWMHDILRATAIHNPSLMVSVPSVMQGKAVCDFRE
ncbi:ArsR/SmtB family transcription factor [Salinivibrio socompensis]|uniref:ArsR/SmtB family transcription factor n=1 Tax=Salinivibrio socompensis TaxID=1510206 RepID=UPI000471B941|nr:metalloregulator ArsR/SmtB family transcription factor [Salinivibrio socompensis]